MSEEIKHSLEEVLSSENLQNLEKPERVEQRPDAQVVHWDESKAVTTTGTSIASFMDRFKAGGMTGPQLRILQGFYSQFTEQDERVVFVNNDLKNVLGDQAMALTQETDDAYAVAVRSPEEAIDVVSEYDSGYAGEVEDNFWQEIDSRHVMVPALYNENGVISNTGISLMGSKEMIASDNTITAEQMLEEDRDLESMGQAQLQSHQASESAEAEKYIDVMLPPDYDKVDHKESNNSLVIEIDGENQLVDGLDPEEKVIGYTENNGVYSLKMA